MKKIAKYLIFIMVMEAVLVCFTGCNLQRLKKDRNKSEGHAVMTEDGDTRYSKGFGTYVVSKGWEESKTHSGNGKYFYVKDGEDNEKRPNNISINAGTNKYQKSEHEQFRSAIYAQLVKQASGSNAEITANGSTTKKGEIVYTFVIDSAEGSITKQYYIVGEKKYVMIYESVWNKDDEKDVDEVALKMLNSFEWSN